MVLQEFIQPGTEVPSGSYIAYELSTEYGSELQKAQAQRTRDSTEAWKGMPKQSVLHDIPEHVSAEGLQRIQALIARFRGARHAAPAEASLRFCFPHLHGAMHQRCSTPWPHLRSKQDGLRGTSADCVVTE